jgi:hypothetical protein
MRNPILSNYIFLIVENNEIIRILTDTKHLYEIIGDDGSSHACGIFFL